MSLRGALPLRAFFLLVVMMGVPLPVSAYEEPEFEVVLSSPAFELRRYAPQLVVETTVRGGFDEARNEAFMRLFRYISGANVVRADIAMTVPVTTVRRRETIAMTVPVISGAASADGITMQFFLPSRYTLDTAPQPTESSVAVRLLPERWIAARRYSGRSNERNFERERAVLQQAVAVASLQMQGEPMFAVYNGPFTPWFMRRNEALIDVRAPATEN